MSHILSYGRHEKTAVARQDIFQAIDWKPVFLASFILAATCFMTTGMPAYAAPAPATSVEAVQINADPGQLKEITLQIGKTVVIDLPRNAADILISNPEVADGILRTARQVILIGKSLGSSDVLFFDQNGQRILTLDVRIGFDEPQLEDAIQRHFPGANVKIERLLGNIVLSGSVSSSSEAQDIYRFVSSFAARDNAVSSDDESDLVDPGQAAGTSPTLLAQSPEDGPIVINRISVHTEEQVMLKVRIAELSRSVAKRLGINWQAGLQASSLTLGQDWSRAFTNTLNGLSTNFPVDDEGTPLFRIGSNVADSYFLPTGEYVPSVSRGRNAAIGLQTTLDTLLKALEQYGLVRTLAEPSLTAVSGEEASFLAGGEFPIATSSDGELSIDFKRFGVSLDFVPVVLSGGRISLKVATEISELSSEGSVVLGSASVPGLTVRRANTTVELPSGGAMVMAGLLQQSTRRLSSGLPGLRQLPVLGQLFRSEEFENEETELVILVTPYLVKPGQPDDFKLPTDGFAPGSDLDIFLLGKLHATYGAGTADPKTAGRALEAPFGYIME